MNSLSNNLQKLLRKYTTSNPIYNKYRKAWGNRIENLNPTIKIILIGALGLTFIGGVSFYIGIIRQLPDISKIENIAFSQATQITDRNGVVLYKMFQENRDYVPFEQINQNMINAIIAVEDQDFWNNNGIDYLGMVRAGFSSIMKGNITQGGSTITQQLIKNLLLTRDRTITRKLKEIVLTSKIDNVIENEILKKNPDISSTELQRKMKEKIIELYLNYIFLGNNNYGVEAASKAYFWTSANNLSILQASIVASLPKAPSLYDPYKNKDILMGALTISSNGTEIDVDTGIQNEVIATINNNINSINLDIRKDNEAFLKFIKGITSFDIPFSGKTYSVTYTPWRKDLSLTRMFEEGYINQQQLKQAFTEGLTTTFQRNRASIKAPHFVFWIIDELKKKYDEETLLKGGLIVKTTLDYSLQQMAEESIKENLQNFNEYWANNTALIYTDSKNGDVLSYVGSIDYDNDKINGKFDVVQGLRQPGSSIKPLVYSYGFMKLNIAEDTPIYDIPFKVGKDEPNNNDGTFEGLLPLKKALWHSRNIPAIKMYFGVGEEKTLKPFFKDLGISTLDDNREYGYPLALGAGEVKMLELANAYMHLSALGKPAKIDPILEIRSNDGSILYQKKIEIQKQVIPSGVGYIMWDILSNMENLPATWVGNFTISGLKFASKSGTSDMKLEDGTQRPRDGWLAVYTPSKVALFWWGNSNGAPMKPNAYGGWLNGRIWRTFFRKMIKSWVLKNENISPVEVKNVSISKISGRIPSDDTPAEMIVNSTAYLQTVPNMVDPKVRYVEIDKICGWKKSDTTPMSDIVKGYVITPTSFMPNNMDLDDIKQRWSQSAKKVTNTTGEDTLTGKIIYNFRNIFIEEPQEVCKERVVQEDTSIQINILKPASDSKVSRDFSLRYQAKANNTIRYIRVLLNDYQIAEFGYNKSDITDIKNLKAFSGVKDGANYLTVSVVDDKGFSNKTVVPVTIISEDKNPPYLMKDKVVVNKKSDGLYEVILLFWDDLSHIKGGKITVNGKDITFDKNLVTFETEKLEILKYEVSDVYNNKLKDTLDLTVYSPDGQ